jgi:hypothetical protein
MDPKFHRVAGARLTFLWSEADADLARAYKEIGPATGMRTYDQAKLRRYIAEERLFAWRLQENGEDQGFALIVFYDGPPYLHIHPPPLHRRLWQESVEALAPVFFSATACPCLYLYMPRSEAMAIHDDILDAGFDLHPDKSGIDQDRVACYFMERSTYEAYYGDADPVA